MNFDRLKTITILCVSSLAIALSPLTAAIAGADQLDRLSWLERAAAGPAGMGGAYTAVPGGAAAMFWNPSAAMHSNRLSISGTHSLRHFPGKTKNLDQFDSDTVGAVIPIAGRNVLGLGFTIPGEWGIDYSDTNGLLNRDATPDGDKPRRLRGRERRVELANIHPDAGKRGLGSSELSSNWYRAENNAGASVAPDFVRGGGFSFFYQDNNGFSYGVNIRLHKRKYRSGARTGVTPRLAGEVKLGAAYRKTPQSDTLAAVDIEARSAGNGRVEWRYFTGLERKYRDKAFARVGLMDGEATYGAGARFSHLKLDYAVVRNLLPRVAGENPGRFLDGHFLSYTLTE